MTTEQDLIEAMQTDTALLKKVLARMAPKAEELASINHAAGRYEASADAMIWHGALHRMAGDLLDAHGKASKALIRGYGEAVVAAGPWR